VKSHENYRDRLSVRNADEEGVMPVPLSWALAAIAILVTSDLAEAHSNVSPKPAKPTVCFSPRCKTLDVQWVAVEKPSPRSKK
jgi:hypothetical protein